MPGRYAELAGRRVLWAHAVLWPVLVVAVVLGDRLSALLTRQIRGEIRGDYSGWLSAVPLWFGTLFPLLVAGLAVLPILRPGRRPVAVLAVAWALALLLDLALGRPYLFPRIAGYPAGFVLETALFGCLVGVGWLTIRKRSPWLRPLGVVAAVLTPVLLLGLADVVAAPFSNWFQDHGPSPVHLLLVLGYLLPAAAVAWIAAALTRRSDRGARPERATVGAGGRPD